MIGSTSWMIPGTYLDNAKLLRGIVDFVELLVYDWSEDVRKLIYKESDKLLELDLAYTVHLPTNSIFDAKRALDFFEGISFPILNYVLHPMDGWKSISWGSKVSIENLKYRIDAYDRMVFDVGHHILGMKFPANLVENIVEVHLMGVKEGKDHVRLDKDAASVAMGFVRDDVLVNFEVFDLDDLLYSIEVWQDVWHHR